MSLGRPTEERGSVLGACMETLFSARASPGMQRKAQAIIAPGYIDIPECDNRSLDSGRSDSFHGLSVHLIGLGSLTIRVESRATRSVPR